MRGRARLGPARRRAAIATVAALTLLTTLLRVPPAHADQQAEPDRSHVVLAWQEGGPQVRSAAEAALLGPDEQVSAFLTEGWEEARRQDERDSLTNVIANGGPSLRAKAQAALDADAAGDRDAISTFLTSGWQAPADIDLRVSVNQLMSEGGEQLKQAAQDALDSGDSERLEKFLESGWRTQWNTDQRLRVNQAIKTGGENVQAEGQKALDAGTPEALEAFFAYGWAVASARDDETATLEELLQQTEAAGVVAEQETVSATAEAARAEDAAQAARRSAAEAAAATKAARENATEAKRQAKRAAVAAEKAADAARVAVQSAAAANRAARAAATAAARAAQMASKANQRASEAYRAAASASVDADKADTARQAAGAAMRIAQETEEAALKVTAAAKALEQGKNAIKSARNAAEHAVQAAVANDEAVRWAQAAGAEAGEAVAAAARARANAERAVRAARAAENHLQTALDAAYKARDAAQRAAANANAAAVAALDAAKHAGDAAKAAERATAHANAAIDAAHEALETATQANAVYEAARVADAERLAVAKEEGLENARVANVTYEKHQRLADWDADQAAKRDEETDRLIAVAKNPATERAEAVAAARKAALNLASGQGAWTRESALAALGSPDDLVLEFVRTDLAEAVAQDNRLAVMSLSISEDDDLAAAAKTALDGDDTAVATFLRTQNYPGRYSADRLKVNQILSAAQEAGDVVLAERAQQALDAETPQALRDFLETGRYTAEAIGNRVRVNQILADEDSGPELKAAAQVALEGPAPGLRMFLDTGRYTAAERDYESATHLAVVAGLLKKIHEGAETALQHAYEAQRVAAEAREDAGQAASYAQQALDSAKRASQYAQQAASHAQQAATSAQKASQSVRTAREAATRANTSARSAVRSATWAITSQQKAIQAANRAGNAARTAHKEALRAGSNAKAALAAAAAASDAVREAAIVQAYICADTYNTTPFEDLEKLYGQEGQYVQNCADNYLGSSEDLAVRAYINSAFCDIYDKDGQDYQNCINSVLDPGFQVTQSLNVTLRAIQYGNALMLAAGMPALIGCAVTLVCGTVMTIGEVGLEIYRLVMGDQSLGKTLLNIGTIALTELAFYGVGKLISGGLRAIKNAGKAALGRSTALSEVRIGLIRNRHQLVLAEVQAMLRGDYSTGKNTAFFWSGRTETGPEQYRNAGPEEAAGIAREEGGTTLEMLMDGRGIPQANAKNPEWDPAEMPWDKIKEEVDQAWDRISLLYARNASGEVKVVLGQSLREDAVWLRQECGALLANPHVTKITAIDLVTKVTREITKKSECVPITTSSVSLAA
ncbi:ALF repeat-containing protein [Nonomuraea sp. NPDC049504]|uniref:ALF repeat-containing protein n=1 Tax=Nonomuraea sp. NPDC049504 TaxID=3154729 RepID=UPI00341EDF81